MTDWRWRTFLSAEFALFVVVTVVTITASYGIIHEHGISHGWTFIAGGVIFISLERIGSALADAADERLGEKTADETMDEWVEEAG